MVSDVFLTRDGNFKGSYRGSVYRYARNGCNGFGSVFRTVVEPFIRACALHNGQAVSAPRYGYVHFLNCELIEDFFVIAVIEFYFCDIFARVYG